MSEQPVKVEKAKREPKPKAEPKPPRFSKNWDEEKWAKKLAGMTVDKVPDGWINMAEIVKAAVSAGIKRSRICTAMGGDRCASEPWDPIFQVKYVGGRKYGSPEILTKGFTLLADAEYHKPARRGRVKKEGADAEKGKVKAKVPNPTLAWGAKE